MKKVLASVFSLLILFFNTGLAYAVEVPAGTSVPIVLNSSVQSDSINEGDIVSIDVVEDVYVHNKKVFSKGTSGMAYVQKVEHTSHHGGAGYIEIKDAKISDVYNHKHNVQLNIVAKGKSKRPSSIALSVIGVLCILVPFGCWRYGDQAIVPQSKVYNAVVPSSFDL